MIPGSNILRTALGVIAPQPVVYLRYAGSTTRDDGVEIPAFEPPVTVYGSWQAVTSEQLVRYGLDPARDYAYFFASVPIQQPGRDVSGDRCEYGGATWEARSGEGWFPMDGWDAMLFERVAGPTP